MERIRRYFKRLFFPGYSETVLFIMGFSVLFASAINGATVAEFLASSARDMLMAAAFGGILVLPFLVVLLSVYHAFSRREKTFFEKKLLLWFAVAFSVFIALMAVVFSSAKTAGAYIFPVWNLFYAYLIVLLYRRGVINELTVGVQNARPQEIWTGALAVAVIFAGSRFLFSHHWTLSLSVTAGLAPVVSALVLFVFNVFFASKKMYGMKTFAALIVVLVLACGLALSFLLK